MTVVSSWGKSYEDQIAGWRRHRERTTPGSNARPEPQIPSRRDRRPPRRPSLRVRLDGWVMRIPRTLRFSLHGSGILQATGLLDHPTLGGNRSYQGMSGLLTLHPRVPILLSEQ